MNKLFTSIAAVSLGLTMAIGVGTAVGTSVSKEAVRAEAAEEACYTLTPASGSNNSYTGNCDITIDGITWNLTGNSTMQPWRIGGKSLSGVDRPLYSKTAISNNVSKIEVTHGTASSITVNTWTLIVSRNADFSSPISTLTPTFSASNTTTISRPSGVDWSNCYYKFIYKVTVNGSSNKFLQFTEAKFYQEATATHTVSFNGNGATGSMSPVTDVSGSYTLPANGFDVPSGQAFAGWKANNTGDLIAAGGTYNVGADVTFYAQWAAQRTVAYNANGGSNTMTDPNSPYGDGATVTVLANSFDAPSSDKRFSHWNTAADDTGTSYDAGDTFTISANTILYAIWEDMPSEININYSSYSANLPASGYSKVDWTANGIDGKVYSVKNTNNVIQFQANTSYIYNSVAISGYIKSITISKYSGSFTQLTAFVGNSAIDAKPESGGINNNTDWTWTFDPDDHYSFFRIDSTSSGAKYFSNIIVAYEKVSQVDPTGITLDDSTAISMDTYSYGRRKLSATIEPFNANDKTVTWGTNDNSVVTISDGVLTAVGIGTTTVYAHTANYDPENPNPDLIKTVSVTVYQAGYRKATFIPSSTSAATQADDYLSGGSVSLSATSVGSWNTDKNAIQLSSGKDSKFTISGYAGMQIVGIDLIMSSNGNAGTGSLNVTIGETNVLTISTAPFSDPTWNGAYDANECNIYKDSTDYVVKTDENIVFDFSATANSLYIHSVSVRYLDYSLEQWCESFITTLKGGDDPICKGVGITDTDALKDAWDTLGIDYLYNVSDDVKYIIEGATPNEGGTIIEQAAYLYDWCVTHYDSSTCDRFIDNRSSNGAPIHNNPVIIGANSDNIIPIIVIVSLISVSAIGGYFYIRRRKEHN